MFYRNMVATSLGFWLAIAWPDKKLNAEVIRRHRTFDDREYESNAEWALLRPIDHGYEWQNAPLKAVKRILHRREYFCRSRLACTQFHSSLG